jgi:alkylhydroperoxidase family enzyme
MRLPYLPNPPPTANATDADILERTLARRGARGLQPLDLTLLHSPVVTDGFISFFNAIRTQTSLTAAIREIAICRVAVLTKAEYEWQHHAPIAAKAGVDVALLKGSGEGLSPRELAVLRYTDAMTRDVTVPEDIFAQVRAHFEEKEIVEITATIAAYNFTSRFLLAMDVGERNQYEDVDKWLTESPWKL